MDRPIVGFTGSRAGMTPEQRKTFRRLIIELSPAEFHHGACKGNDADAVMELDAMMSEPFQVVGTKIIGWPGVSAKGGENPDRDQLSIERSDVVMAERTHFERNREIAAVCSVLIAVPAYSHPIDKDTKGGTAYTVNQARKKGKRIIVIPPSGVAYEGN